MHWQDKIFNRIITTHNPAIIIDYVGILQEHSFLNYISKMGNPFTVCSTVKELISIYNEKKSIIISNFKIPTFIKNQFDIDTFHWQDLPLNISSDLYTKISINELVILLENSEKKTLPLITINNYKKIISKQLAHKSKQNIELLKKEISEQINKVVSAKQLISLGKNWGNYIYENYKNDLIPDSKLMVNVDAISRDIAISGDIAHLFFEHETNLYTVDKILAHIESSKNHRIALICFDGMGWGEWRILEEYLKINSIDCKADGIFALIPTTTSISRKAIFSGEYNIGFEKKNIDDSRSFKSYYNERNLHPAFLKEGNFDSSSLLGIDRAGIIYNVFDDLAHSSEFPANISDKSLFYEAAKNYLSKSTIAKEIKLFKSEGFKIYFCSDHGSVVGLGNGKRIEKHMIDEATKRAILVEDSVLLEQYQEYIHYQIPIVKNKTAIIAEDRGLYAYNGRREISHGGVTVEELIVPFVEVLN